MKSSRLTCGKKLLGVITVALLLVITACTSSPSTPTVVSTGPSVTIDLIAQNLTFDKSSITVSAGAVIAINFTNKDPGISHNFALYTDSGASKSLFIGKTISSPSGASTTTYKFTAPAANGTYFFRCDIHPTMMTGNFIVQ